MFKKIALLENLIPDIMPASVIAADTTIQLRFAKVAEALREEQRKSGGKQLSPFVDDFLYVSAIMMTAAEACLIDEHTGEPLKNSKGDAVRGWFETIKDAKGRDSVKWVSPDEVKLYRNNNLDIFPEDELLKAHKNWVGKPLCKDHISNSVDGIRGIIVDTFYDPKFKRVHALFALDKKNYPDLARKVEAGYATCVSMGTAVGRSVCSECYNVASSAHEFCSHVKARTLHGEINLDLTPIELSLVVTGADPRAKIRQVVASIDAYRQQAAALRVLNGAPLEGLDAVTAELERADRQIRKIAFDFDAFFRDLGELLGAVGEDDKEAARKFVTDIFSKNEITAKDVPEEHRAELARHLKFLGVEGVLQDSLLSDLMTNMSKKYLSTTMPTSTTDTSMSGTKALTDRTDIESGDMGKLSDEGKVGEPSFGSNALQNFASRYGEHAKRVAKLDDEIEKMTSKISSIKTSLDTLNSNYGLGGPDSSHTPVKLTQETIMTFDEMRKRAAERKRAYLLGTDETRKYPLMGDQDAIRLKDRQMVGDELDTKADNPDAKVKELLLRAQLEERISARAARFNRVAESAALKGADGKVVATVDKLTGKVQPVKQMAAADGVVADKETEDDKKDDVSAEEQKKAAFQRIDMLKAAAKKKQKEKAEKSKAKGKFDPKIFDKKDDKKKKDVDAKKKKDADDKKKKDAKSKKKKVAYLLGTDETRKYPQMGDQDAIRLKDRQMVGDELDTKAENPDAKVKELLLRAQMTAAFEKNAAAGDQAWVVAIGPQRIFRVTAAQAYEDNLGKMSPLGVTWGQVFASDDYAQNLMKEIRAGGLSALAEELAPLVDPAAGGTDLGADMGAALNPEATPPEGMPGLDAVPGMDDAAPAPDATLKEDIAASLDKVETAVGEIKSLVIDDEGVADLNVNMQPDDSMVPATAAMDRSMFEVYAQLTDLAAELRFLHAKADLSKTVMKNAARAAVRDAKLAVFAADDQILAYANLKGDEMEDDADLEQDCGDMYSLDADELEQVDTEVKESLDAHVDSDHESLDDALKAVKEHVADLEKQIDSAKDGATGLPGMGEAAAKDGAAEKKEEKEEKAEEKKEEEKKAALAQRKAARAALVTKAAKSDSAITSDPLLHIHKGDEGKVDLGMTIKDNANVVENMFDAHGVMLDIAQKPVKTVAASIDAAIKKGSLQDSQLNGLVAVGMVDAAAVKYYRDYYKQTDGGDEFARGLVADFKKSASEQQTDKLEKLSIRYKRAYHIAMDAQRKGICRAGEAALDEYVDGLVGMPDEMFESVKRVVAQTVVTTKRAGFIPQVGVIDRDDEERVKIASSGSSVNIGDAKALARALFGDKK